MRFYKTCLLNYVGNISYGSVFLFKTYSPIRLERVESVYVETSCDVVEPEEKKKRITEENKKRRENIINKYDE